MPWASSVMAQHTGVSRQLESLAAFNFAKSMPDKLSPAA
jgi:hypothetical protein